MSRYIDPCWSALGIAPTSDQRAIRSAYTARLKSIDPEVDPQAFIALREAFERARIEAQWVDLPDHDEDEDWDDYDPEPEGGYHYSPITGAAIAAEEAAADDRYRALADFLLPDGERRERALNDDDERELQTLFEAALADPRLETIAFQADADRWFAETLARAWPASDAVLLAAARRFGWDAGAEPGIYITPAVDFINARLRDACRYGTLAYPDPAAAPATEWSDPAPEGNPLSPPQLETSEDKLPDAVPLTDGRPEWETDSYRVRDPVGGEGPRFEWDREAREEHIPLPGSGPDWQPVASPWGPANTQDADRHARALADLVYAHADGETYASADQKTAMLEHLRAITADPRMQEIAFFADADRWFSELIARGIPFADPLIIPATRFFGWTRSDGTITQSWAAETITRRYAAIEFMDAVQKPDHPLNAAWRELTKPAGEKTRRGRVNARAVERLLTTVRTHYPDLEGAFDHYRVGLWDNSSERQGCSWTGWVFAILFVLVISLRIAGSIGGGEKSALENGTRIAPSAERLFDDRADIEWALKELFEGELTRAQVWEQNAALNDALTETWHSAAKDRVPRASFLTDVRVLVGSWYFDGVRKGDAGLLTEYQRLTIDIGRALEGDAVRCAAFLRGSRDYQQPGLNPELAARERELMIRTLLTTDGGTPSDLPSSVPVPGSVIDKAAKRAGRPREQIEQALLFKGPPAQLCPSRLAFMEAVLELPVKQRLPLMRIM